MAGGAAGEKMELRFKVDLSPTFGRKLAWLEKLPQAAMTAGGTAVYDFLRDYHSKMTWRGERWMPGANTGQFADKVVDGWQPPVVAGNKVIVKNTFGLLDWKIRGGTITPKAAQFLTIPLVPGAKGLSVAEYRAASGDTLFKAGMAICHKIGKEIEAIYALSREVTQAPWPKAMPSDEALKGVFTGASRALIQGGTPL